MAPHCPGLPLTFAANGVALPAEAADEAWIEVIPAGPGIVGRDGREFFLRDPKGVVAAFNNASQPIPVDYNHGSEKEQAGQPAPAAGWIEELAVRAGAVIARVRWTPRGREAVTSREYRFVSPAFLHHPATLEIKSLLSVGLVHHPNFALPALNHAEAPRADAPAKATNMMIQPHSLRDLQSGFKSSFQEAFNAAAPIYPMVATVVPSSTSEERYAWLGAMPTMREWLGDRVVRDISESGYAIRNRLRESTISAPRERIEDDQYGVYKPLFQEMGREAALHPDRLMFQLLKSGFSTACYDGQSFFDTDHPVIGPWGRRFPPLGSKHT